MTSGGPVSDASTKKEEVLAFWDAASCGEVYAEGETSEEQFQAHSRARYNLEPYILDFARFEDGRDKDVLEIGVGMAVFVKVVEAKGSYAAGSAGSSGGLIQADSGS